MYQSVNEESVVVAYRADGRRYCRCGAHLAADNSGNLCAPCQRQLRERLICPPAVPASFWLTPQMQDAFTAQHMGQVARAYRLHIHHQAVYGAAGISQALLGQWMGMTQAQVSRIENGAPIKNLDTLTHWARVLRIPPELLWFDLPGRRRITAATVNELFDNIHGLGGQSGLSSAGAAVDQEVNTASDDSPVSSDAIGSGLPAMKGITVFPEALGDLATLLVANLALFDAITSGTAMSGDEAGERLTDLDRLVEEVKRRGLIRLFGQLAAGSTVTSPVLGGLRLLGSLDLNPDEQERVTKSIVSPGRVDEKVIGYIETLLWACKRQDDTFGPQAVLNIVLDQQRLVRDVLLPECSDGLKPRMLSLYSSLCESAGWYLFELDNFEPAWRQFEQARKLAHEARNAELSTYIPCHMSYAALWMGERMLASDLAAVAQNLVVKTSDPLLRVCVADTASSSYAANGQHSDCMEELDKAQTILSDSAGRVPPESLAYYVSDGFLANDKSDCLLRLGKPREAVASARAGLALYDRSFVRGLAFCTLRLGKALIQSKEIDEAATVLAEAAQLATQNLSARLLKELHTARTTMQPWQDTRAVSELDEQLAGLGLASSL